MQSLLQDILFYIFIILAFGGAILNLRWKTIRNPYNEMRKKPEGFIVNVQRIVREGRARKTRNFESSIGRQEPMMMRWSGSIIIFLAIIAFSVEAYSADTSTTNFTARVKVTVTASDNVMSTVNSYMKRELLSLNDVELVDDNPEWEINVMALELFTVGGNKVGVAVSTVFISHYNNQLLSGFFQQKFKDTGLEMTSHLYLHPEHRLNIGSPDDLNKICRDIVEDFDTKYLEESRKDFRKIK